MYLTIQLTYSNDEATLIYHIFNTIVLLLSFLGAALSDSWLGKYRTILCMASVYACGLVLLNLASITVLNLPERPLTIAALLLIAIGAGALRPCSTAFGGDQFQLPHQEHQLVRYFSVYYMVTKVAFLCGAALAPVLRQDVQCFGNAHCFPLAFGVPGITVLFALASFLLGNLWYVKRPAASNVVLNVGKCIWVSKVLRVGFTSIQTTIYISARNQNAVQRTRIRFESALAGSFDVTFRNAIGDGREATVQRTDAVCCVSRAVRTQRTSRITMDISGGRHER